MALATLAPATVREFQPTSDRARREPEPLAAEVIPGMRGTVLHQTSVETYRRHHPGSAGLCVICYRPDRCPARAFAARVIEAAGDNPRAYDYPDAPGPARPQRVVAAEAVVAAEEPRPARDPSAKLSSGEVTGYAVGGVGRPRAPYHVFDR